MTHKHIVFIASNSILVENPSDKPTNSPSHKRFVRQKAIIVLASSIISNLIRAYATSMNGNMPLVIDDWN